MWAITLVVDVAIERVSDMVSHWLKKSIGKDASTQASGNSSETHQHDRAGSNNPAVVGLCRVMTLLSVLLLAGLLILGWVTLKSGIDWDASVVPVDRDNTRSEDLFEVETGAVVARVMTDVVRFDLGDLNSEGLLGSEDGLRALSYEFCVPASETHVEEVRAIDVTLSIQRGSPGRIGCGEAEYLAIGNTHQSDFRRVLERLGRLPYIERIEQVHFE